MSTGERIAAEARTWIGTPFRHAACKKKGEPGAGVDCIGILIGVARELGLASYEDGARSRLVHPEQMRLELLKFMDVAVAPRLPGDIALFAVRDQVQHIGILTGEGTIIHAWESVGSVVEITVSRAVERMIREELRWRDA